MGVYSVLKVAVVDIGSNSLRMQISEVKDKSYKVLEDYKEMIRLGDSIYTQGYFSADIIETLVSLLKDIKSLAESRGCETVRAVATAAFRESDNLAETLIRIEQEAGISVEVINGEEEARLTYLAATANFELLGRRAVVMDIGGGSAEYSVIDNGRLYKSASLPMGCNRLTREFLHDNPPSPKEILDMNDRIRSQQEQMELENEIDMVICTGGSMNNVAYVNHFSNKDMRDSAVKYVERKFLKRFIADLKAKPVAERVRTISGLEEKRADIILAAALQTDIALQTAGVNGFYTLSGGLRAGLTIDTINKMGIELPFQNSTESIRFSRLLEIGNKFDFDEESALQVVRLGRMLFDGLSYELELTVRDRLMLEAACLLRDIGKHIAFSKHHKHSYYLIKHSELVGYSFDEVEMIALVARYHRKSPPKNSHEDYQAIDQNMQRRVDKLSAILRIAIALDRSHKGFIKDIKVDVTDDAVIFKAEAGGDISMEMKDFERKRELLVKIMKRPVRFL